MESTKQSKQTNTTKQKQTHNTENKLVVARGKGCKIGEGD